jgi:uncharacterized protein (UPF0264 family)
MRLLVSVRNAAEAAAALAGGADIIDAKEPLNGPLGPVEPRVLRSIAAAVGGAAPVTAALGDVMSDDIDRGLNAARGSGVALVKLGFAGLARTERLVPRVATLVEAARPATVILVAYADYVAADAPSPAELLRAAHRSGAAGILLDTCDKAGPGLMQLMTPDDIRDFVAHAKTETCIVTLAGKLGINDVSFAFEAGADVVGVRGAACEGGRNGHIARERVATLSERIARAHHAIVTEPLGAN